VGQLLSDLVTRQAGLPVSEIAETVRPFRR
jgi:hypothetical protein